MRKTLIPGTQLKCSKFAFGTASLLRVGSTTKRQKLLKTAADSGFTHFDTAPYYGFGVAEKDLRCFSANPEITIATKVGIYPPGGGDQSDAVIKLRKAAGKVIKSLSKPTIDYSVHRASVSLEASLRRLGREYVDLFLLHEPKIELLNTDEWFSWMSRAVMSGKIRYFGISTTKSRALPFLQQNSGLLQVSQLQDTVDDPVADLLDDYGRVPQFTFGYVSSATYKDRSQIDQILGRALITNPNGAIIVSTTKLDRLKQYPKVLESLL